MHPYLSVIASSRRRFGSEAYRAAVLADSPVAYWRLGEASGTTAADEVGSYAGTYVGSPTLGGSGVFTGNSAASFNGSSQYITASALGSRTSWSIECWVKFASTSGEQTAISNDLVGWNNDVLVGLHPEAAAGAYTGKIAAVHQDATSSVRTVVANPSSATTGVWYHVAVTSNGSTMRLYVNSLEVAATAKAGTALTLSNNPINLARNPQGIRFLNGSLDEVAIYSSALSSTRIAAHYAAAGY